MPFLREDTGWGMDYMNLHKLVSETKIYFTLLKWLALLNQYFF